MVNAIISYVGYLRPVGSILLSSTVGPIRNGKGDTMKQLLLDLWPDESGRCLTEDLMFLLMINVMGLASTFYFVHR